MDIPEYYRKYHSQTSPPKLETVTPAGQPPKPGQAKPPGNTFKANEFTINIYDGWLDKTIYILTVPVTDGMQHNIIVNIEPDAEVNPPASKAAYGHYITVQLLY